uniref:Uncharacterized protein n=1 Tax=Cryptomonas curvata TaxID=233186 RepID=A0A7S0MGA7_9CRYP
MSSGLESAAAVPERPWYEALFGSWCSMCRRDELPWDKTEGRFPTIDTVSARRQEESATNVFSLDTSQFASSKSLHVSAAQPASSGRRSPAMILPSNLPDPSKAQDPLSKRKAIVARSEAIIEAIRNSQPNSRISQPTSRTSGPPSSRLQK